MTLLTHRILDGFRLALLSYNDGTQTYARGLSRWADFEFAFITLMRTCVQRGIGGAQLVPRESFPAYKSESCEMIDLLQQYATLADRLWCSMRMR